MKLWLSLFAAFALLLAGCGERQPTPEEAQAAQQKQFRILAGSEVKDLAPYITEAAAAAGITLKFEYAGTLDVVDRANLGTADADAIWVANGAYASLALAASPKASTKTMYSQVLPAVKQSVAARLGWIDAPPTWAEIAAAAEAGELRYAMTSPTASNTGLSALVSVATSIAGKGEGLALDDVNSERIRGFLKGQGLTAGSSGWLGDAFLADQSSLDAIISYEANLQQLNADPRLVEKLVIIRPRDGAVTADYPLMLLNADKRTEYDKLAALIISEPVQRHIAVSGFRRPVIGTVPLAAGLAAEPALDLPFPAALQPVDALLMAYTDKLRRPVKSWFVLDRSGSMQGERMVDLKRAMGAIINGDPNSLSGRYARLANREQTILLSFSDQPDAPRAFFLDAARPTTRADLLRAVEALEASGGTAIYDSLKLAFSQAMATAAADPAPFHSIVLLSDGESNEGDSYAEFAAWYAGLPPERNAIRVFPIVFGEANAREMEELAALTGGRAFLADEGKLAAAFKDIRGYQ